MTKRPPQPTWREQPPTMAVCILAGTGPTAKAAPYLDELAAWLRDARRQMPTKQDGNSVLDVQNQARSKQVNRVSNVQLIQTGACIRMVEPQTGGAFWQTINESGKDREPHLCIGEPIIMRPEAFQLGTSLVVMEPTAPITKEDAELHGLAGDSVTPKGDGAPSRGRILDIIRNAFGPKAGHGSCARAAKGEKVSQICCAIQELQAIARDWKGHQIVPASTEL